MVDNCYGEFVEKKEPTEAGADIMAGSLIKNPGGGLALCGGYVAGKRELVNLASYRMTVPGLGREVGATIGQNRSLFQGFFMAPHTVAESMKGAVFASALFEELVIKHVRRITKSAVISYRQFALKTLMRLSLLPGNTERFSGRFFCQAGTIGNAWL